MLVRRIARPMLGAVFVTGGWDTLLNPESRAPAAETVLGQLRLHTSLPLPDDTALVVRADAAAKLVAGAALSAGRMPRLSAVVLATSLLPTTVAGHRFWEQRDPALRATHRIHFFKNLGLLGGLLLAAVDTEGKPSVGWRARRSARRTAQVAGAAASAAGSAAAQATQAARDALPV